MSYDYDLILKENYGGTYCLTTMDGRILFQCRSTNEYNSMLEARAYMSSWHSVRIRTEEEYEQDQEGDRVPKSAKSSDTATRSDTDVSQARKPD